MAVTLTEGLTGIDTPTGDAVKGAGAPASTGGAIAATGGTTTTKGEGDSVSNGGGSGSGSGAGGGGGPPPAYVDASFSMDGIDEFINLPEIGAYNVSDNLSVVIFFKAPSAGQNFGSIVDKSLGAIGQRQWLIRTNAPTDNKILVALASTDGNSTAKRYFTSSDLMDNQWHQIAFTFSSSTLKVYVDGSEDTLVNKSTDDALAALNTNGPDIRLGSSQSGNNDFLGKMCQVSIWTGAALSDSDISNLYNSGAPIDPTTLSTSATLVGHWPCKANDDLTIASGVEDLSTNGNDGTANNMEAGDIDTVDFPGA